LRDPALDPGPNGYQARTTHTRKELSPRRQRVGDDRDLSADDPRRDDPRPLHVRREPGQSVDLH